VDIGMLERLRIIGRKTTVLQKLLFLTLTGLLPLAVTGAAYWSNKSHDLRQAQRELAGAAYLEAIWPAVTAPSLGLEGDGLAPRAGWGGAFAEATQTAADSFDVGPEATALQSLLDRASAGDAPLTHTDRAELAQAGLMLTAAVADESGLTRDPDPWAHDVQSMLTLHLPAVVMSAEALRAAAAAGGPTDRVDAFAEVSGLQRRLAVVSARLTHLRERTDSPSPTAFEQEAVRLNLFLEQMDELRERLRQDLARPQPGAREALLAEAHSLAFRAIALTDTLWRYGHVELERVVSARLDGYWTDLRILMVLVTLALGAAAALATVLARSIVQPQDRLIDAMQRLVAGDLTVEVPYRTYGAEIGAIARAVEVFRVALIDRHCLADDLEQQRAELERNVRARTLELEVSRQELQQTTVTLTQALGAIRGGAWTFDVVREEGWSSEGFLKLFGVPMNVANSKDGVWAPVHPEDRELIQRARIEALATRDPGHGLDFRIIDTMGETRWVSMSWQWIGETTIAGLMFDITERKRQELEITGARTEAQDARAKAERTAELLSHALQAANAGAWSYDVVTHEAWSSPELEAISGRPYTRAEITDGVWNAIHPDDRELIWEVQRRGRITRNGDNVDVRIIRAQDGEVRWISMSWRPFGGHQVIGVCVDVTDRKRQELELEEARRKAEAASLAKTKFLASMSHEIRTPLNGVLGMAAALQQANLSPEQSEMVGVINEAGAQLLSILNDVLDISKIEAGQVRLENRPFNLEDSIVYATALYDTNASSKGVRLTAEVAADAKGVYHGDSARLRQVLQNLIGNAVKFTEQGDVRIDVSRLRDEGERTWLRIDVSDTGIGIAPDQLDLIFRKFQQADSSITRRFGGSGLGLAISKELATLMGAELSVESTLGRGSRFRLEIPLSRRPAETATPGDAARRAARPQSGRQRGDDVRPLRILSADDSAMNRLVLSTLLGQAGFQSEFVEDGARAVQAAATVAYDLILMDVHMPTLDGIAAAQAIRAGAGPSANAPIIALTADAMPEHVARCLAAGMNGHVAKPIQPAELFQAIEAALAGPVAEAPAKAG
jgi:PAS domain S-box-containing protein